MQAKPQQVQREVPFSMLLPANQLFEILQNDPGEDVLVHGIMDGYVTEADGVTLFDYKTDHEPDPAKLVARYRGQLNLYAQALAQLQPRAGYPSLSGLVTDRNDCGFSSRVNREMV